MIPKPERPDAPKVTLEELLRIKRAERPETEFWNRFEQDLRAKQLAAIVEPRPWWITLRLPQVARTLARYQLPAGAAALLALSLIAVRDYRPEFAAPSPILSEDATEQTVAVASSFISGETAPVVEPVRPAVLGDTVVLATAESYTSPAPRIASVEALPVGPGELLAMIPWAAPHTASAQSGNAEPVALGELPKAYFASAIKPAREHRFDETVGGVSVNVTTTEPARDNADDLADPVVQASPVSPREMRRKHILSSLVVADNAEADRSRMSQVREVLTSSLDNDQLYDSVRRVGMGGDRLTLKF